MTLSANRLLKVSRTLKCKPMDVCVCCMYVVDLTIH